MCNVNKGKKYEVHERWHFQMSFSLGLDRIQEALVLALMLVFFAAVFYSNIETLYKILISFLVFTIVILVGFLNQAIKQKENTQL